MGRTRRPHSQTDIFCDADTGTAITVPISVTTPARSSFTMTIGYHLGSKRVGVVVKGVADGDALNIFAARLDKPVLNEPGVVYACNMGSLHETEYKVR